MFSADEVPICPEMSDLVAVIIVRRGHWANKLFHQEDATDRLRPPQQFSLFLRSKPLWEVSLFAECRVTEYLRRASVSWLIYNRLTYPNGSRTTEALTRCGYLGHGKSWGRSL